MKSIYSILLVLGLIFTPNAQADEIINAADMFAVPIVELQDLDTNFDQIDNDIDEGLHIFYQENDRQFNGDSQGGFGEHVNTDIAIEGQTAIAEIGRSYTNATAIWRPVTSKLSLQGTGEGDTYLSRDDNELTRSNYDTKANHKQRGGKAYQLAYTHKVGGHRCAFMESDGHSFKIH